MTPQFEYHTTTLSWQDIGVIHVSFKEKGNIQGLAWDMTLEMHAEITDISLLSLL